MALQESAHAMELLRKEANQHEARAKAMTKEVECWMSKARTSSTELNAKSAQLVTLDQAAQVSLRSTICLLQSTVCVRHAVYPSLPVVDTILKLHYLN